MKGRGKEGLSRNKAERTGSGFPQPTSWSSHPSQKVPPGRVVPTHSRPRTGREAAKNL